MIRKFIVSLILFTSAFAFCLAKQTPQEIFVQSEGANLFCKVIGQGSPVIVIHGRPPLSHDYLLPQIENLAKNHLVIFYDQRGCGRSNCNISTESITLDNFLNDLDAIRKAFHFDKLSLLGHSWGGFLAMQYAIAHPENVDKLILCSSLPPSTEELGLFFEEFKKRGGHLQDELAEIKTLESYQKGDPDTMERYFRLFFSVYFYRPEDIDLLNLRMTQTAAVNGSKVYEFIRSNIYAVPFNLHPALTQLSIPTLILHGDVDLIPPITAEDTHKSIAGSKYILMKNCGHFPHIEQPDDYFKHLTDFLMQ